MSIEEKVQKIIIDYVEPPDGFSMSSTFSEIGCDSMTMMDVILEIEDEFNVLITGDKLEELKTPNNLIDFLIKK